jgi:hypothetical protein
MPRSGGKARPFTALALKEDSFVAPFAPSGGRGRIGVPQMPEGLQGFPDGTAGSELAPYIASLFDPALTWKDIEWLGRTRRE